MIIEASNFFNTGKLLIVNANRPNKGEYSELMSIIEQYEYEFYFKCLGPLAADYINGNTSGTTVDQKWTDLKEGSTYTLNDVTVKFRGLDEICAHYIWIKYQEQVSQPSPVGDVEVSEDQVSNNSLLVGRWNDMVDLIGFRSIGTYYVPSLYTYLSDTTTYTYENYCLSEFKYINQMI